MNFDFIGKKNLKNSGFAFTVMMIIYVLLSFVGQAIVLAVTKQGSVLYYVISSLFSVVSILLTVIFFLPEKNKGLIKSVGIVKFNPIYIIPAITLSVGMFLGFGFVNDTIGTALKNAGLNVSAISLPLDNAWQFVLFLITFAVFPAIVEEIFFRGVVLSGFINMGKVLTAVLVATMFAVYHCSLTQLVYQFIYGFFLTLITIKAKSVIPAMIAHFLNNFAVILLSFLKVAINLYSLYCIVVGLVFVVFSALFVFFYGEKNTGKQKPESVLGLVITSLIGVVLCVAMMITGLIV